MTYSSALNQSPCWVRTAKWCGGSHAVTSAPPGSISLGNSQAALPAVVATASQTCSGLAGNTTSRLHSKSGGISSLLFRRLIPPCGGGVVVLGRWPSDAGVKRDDQPVLAPAGRELVVILR